VERPCRKRRRADGSSACLDRAHDARQVARLDRMTGPVIGEDAGEEQGEITQPAQRDPALGRRQRLDELAQPERVELAVAALSPAAGSG
jgi:hypothetical protein